MQINYRRNGEKFWNQVSVTPIMNRSGGGVANFVSVQQDVSERKASEAAFQLRDHALSNLSEVRGAGVTCRWLGPDPLINLKKSTYVFIFFINFFAVWFTERFWLDVT